MALPRNFALPNWWAETYASRDGRDERRNKRRARLNDSREREVSKTDASYASEDE